MHNITGPWITQSSYLSSGNGSFTIGHAHGQSRNFEHLGHWSFSEQTENRSFVIWNQHGRRDFSIKFKLNETYWTLKWKMTICGLSNTVPTIHHNLHSLRQSLSVWSPKRWKLFNEALLTRNYVFQKIYYNDFVLWMFHLEGNRMLW